MNQRESIESQRFKARAMPDFENKRFVPLLNEKPLTIPKNIELEVDKRAESKSKKNDI